MEGYIDVYWRGDKTAWFGLFKNYVWSLFLAFVTWKYGDYVTNLNMNNLQIDNNQITNDNTRELLENTITRNPTIIKAANILAEKNISLRVQELKLLFFATQSIIIDIVSCIFLKCIYPNNNANKVSISLEDKQQKLEHITGKVLQDCSVFSDKDLLNFITSETTKKEYLRAVMHKHSDDKQFFFQCGFIEKYVEQLHSLSFSNWYMISFAADISNPAT